jgi:hypothetical protein
MYPYSPAGVKYLLFQLDSTLQFLYYGHKCWDQGCACSHYSDSGSSTGRTPVAGSQNHLGLKTSKGAASLPCVGNPKLGLAEL